MKYVDEARGKLNLMLVPRRLADNRLPLESLEVGQVIINPQSSMNTLCKKRIRRLLQALRYSLGKALIKGVTLLKRGLPSSRRN